MNAVEEKDSLNTAQIIDLHKNMVYAIALTHTKNKVDADDVFQEVFLNYHRKHPIFTDDEHRKAWLIVTCINCAKQINTSSWQRRVVLTQGDPDTPTTEERFTFRTEEQDMVFTALQELPLKYRTVLHLFYFEDLSVAQISSVLGIEAGTVKVQLTRARAQMRDRLKGEYNHA